MTTPPILDVLKRHPKSGYLKLCMARAEDARDLARRAAEGFVHLGFRARAEEIMRDFEALERRLEELIVDVLRTPPEVLNAPAPDSQTR